MMKRADVFAGIMAGAAAFAVTGTAMAEGYNHKDWPVAKNANGTYSFTSAGQSKAVPLCTAYYRADIEVMDKHNNTTSNYGQLIRDHAVTMRDAYASRYTGGEAAMVELTKDMVWHFGNSAQYGVFQEFKDSANMACEEYAVSQNIVSGEYLNSFMDRLLAGGV